MFNRLPSIRTAWLPVLALALLLVSSIIARAARDPVRLGADVLAQSRGSHPMVGLAEKSCDTLQSNNPCTQVGAASRLALSSSTMTWLKVAPSIRGKTPPRVAVPTIWGRATLTWIAFRMIPLKRLAIAKLPPWRCSTSEVLGCCSLRRLMVTSQNHLSPHRGPSKVDLTFGRHLLSPMSVPILWVATSTFSGICAVWSASRNCRPEIRCGLAARSLSGQLESRRLDVDRLGFGTNPSM